MLSKYPYFVDWKSTQRCFYALPKLMLLCRIYNYCCTVYCCRDVGFSEPVSTKLLLLLGKMLTEQEKARDRFFFIKQGAFYHGLTLIKFPLVSLGLVIFVSLASIAINPI